MAGLGCRIGCSAFQGQSLVVEMILEGLVQYCGVFRIQVMDMSLQMISYGWDQER